MEPHPIHTRRFRHTPWLIALAAALALNCAVVTRIFRGKKTAATAAAVAPASDAKNPTPIATPAQPAVKKSAPFADIPLAKVSDAAPALGEEIPAPNKAPTIIAKPADPLLSPSITVETTAFLTAHHPSFTQPAMSEESGGTIAEAAPSEPEPVEQDELFPARFAELRGSLTGTATATPSLSADVFSETESVVLAPVVQPDGTITIPRGNHTRYTALVRGAANFAGDGTLTFEGGYSPGNSPAIITIAPQTTFASGNTLTLEIGGLTAGPGTPTDNGYDRLIFTSTATPQVRWGGTLVIELINGFTPTPGQSFDLLDFDPARDDGTFATITILDHGLLAPGHSFDTTQLYTTGVVTVIPEPSTPTLIALIALAAVALLRRRAFLA